MERQQVAGFRSCNFLTSTLTLVSLEMGKGGEKRVLVAN